MATEIKVPALGESITEATIGQWLKQPGDAVKLDEPVASLETDKVAVEVAAPAAGVMGAHGAAEGDTVQVGAVIGSITDDAPAAGAEPVKEREAEKPAEEAPAAPSAAPATPAPAAAKEAATEPSASPADLPPLSPAVRRLVLEHGLDPTKIKGTGKDGRLTKDDVVAAVENRAAPTEETKAAAAEGGEAAKSAAPATGDRQEERVKMTRLRQTIAKRLKSAQETAALLTTFNDCDMSAVMSARDKYKEIFEKKHGVKLGFMSFFTKAVALAAHDFPAVNARIEGDEIIYHNYLDVSVAVSAPNGLVVPVVRNADKMSFAEIEKTIGDFGARAKAGTLTMEDMTGGTFTISNGGVFGGLMSTPIINPPQSAVLGLHRIEDRPVVRDGQIVIRPMMYIALSYDHRLIDGREAVTFLKTVKEAIEDPTRILIDL